LIDQLTPKVVDLLREISAGFTVAPEVGRFQEFF
jgi:hypothetical protein